MPERGMGGNLNGDRLMKPTASASEELFSNVSGVLLLLISAKLSLQTHGADTPCIDILRKCIRTMQKQYSLSERDLNEAIVWKEASFNGILRLLEYVEGEVRDRLHDRPMADELQLCVDRLKVSQQLFGEDCEAVRLHASKEDALPMVKGTLRRQ
jgi:hypothetical protein